MPRERLRAQRLPADGRELGAQFGSAHTDGVPVDVQGGERHRAVDVHRYVGGEHALAAQCRELVQNDLGAIESERRDDHRAAPVEGLGQDIGEVGPPCVLVMPPVPVRRLHEEDIRPGEGFWRP